MQNAFILTRDKKRISCIYEGSRKKDILLFIHGIPATLNDPPLPEAVRFFNEKGYATARMAFYDVRKSARQLMDCSLTTLSEDIDRVTRYLLKKGYPRVHVVGHSIGGLAILLSSEQYFSSVSLWDPSYKLSFTKGPVAPQSPIFCESASAYILRIGVNYAVSKELVEQLDHLVWENIGKQLRVPFAVFSAGKGVLHSAKNYTKKANTITEVHVIKEADHTFQDHTAQKKLFNVTKKWIDRWANKTK